jgi:hypothetical protein
MSDIGRFYLRFDANVLSTNEATLNHIQVYNDNSLEEIVVKGQLLEKTKLVLYDIQGRQILNKELNINSSTNRINTSGIMSGVYLVQLNNSYTTLSKKLVIK